MQIKVDFNVNKKEMLLFSPQFFKFDAFVFFRYTFRPYLMESQIVQTKKKKLDLV